MSDPSQGPPPLPPPLPDTDRALLARAAELHRPLARAARLGSGNATAYAVCGGLSLMLAIVSLDVVGLLLGAVVLGVGLFERRECRRLLQADAASPRRLMRAELLLLAAIVLYGLLGLLVLPAAGDALKQQLHDSKGLGIDIGRLADAISRVWYFTVIGISLLYQGGMARYFHGRSAAVARYLEAVPRWARDVVESMAH